MSVEGSHNGVELTTAAASLIRVSNSSLRSRLVSKCISVASNTLLTLPIARSQIPPKWDALGGFNSHDLPSWLKFSMADSSKLST